MVTHMAIHLRWLETTRLPVELDGLVPADLASLSGDQVARRPVPVGNRSSELGELFAIRGDASDGVIRFEGDLRTVSRIGLGLSGGLIEIDGDVGPHLGAGMTGGSIHLRGSAGVWAGAGMRGGRLSIQGKAGNFLGGAYPGARLGMRDGVILVQGDAGDSVGLAMRRGLIAVSGNIGKTPGHGMVAGTLVVGGSTGVGAGFGMKRGSIILLGERGNADILPSFFPSGPDRPPFLAFYLRQLAAWGFPVREHDHLRQYLRYNGDLAAGGQGEIWVSHHTTG